MEASVVCRTCLRPTKKHTSIFSAPNLWGRNIVIAKMIMACAPIVIDIDDGLPPKICENCLQLLQLSFLFRLRVITANKNFKDIIESQVNSLKQVTHQDTLNLNRIYSTDYILESIKDSMPSGKTFEALKQESLNIKEQEKEDNEKNHKISSLINKEGKSLNKISQEVINNLNDVVTPQQKTQNDQLNISYQEKQINNPNNNRLLTSDNQKENQNHQKTKSCYVNLKKSLKITNNKQLNEENQEKNKSSNENSCKSSKTITDDQLHDNSILDKVKHYIIVNTEKPVNNEIDFKLKRTFVRLHDINQITKFQKVLKSKSLSETKTNLLTDNKLKEINDGKQTLQSKQINNECIIIDD